MAAWCFFASALIDNFFLSLGQPGSFCSWYLQKDKIEFTDYSSHASSSCQPAPPSASSFHISLLSPPTTHPSNLVHFTCKPPSHGVPVFSVEVFSIQFPYGHFVVRILESKKKLITKWTQNKTVDVSCKDRSLQSGPVKTQLTHRKQPASELPSNLWCSGLYYTYSDLSPPVPPSFFASFSFSSCP